MCETISMVMVLCVNVNSVIITTWKVWDVQSLYRLTGALWGILAIVCLTNFALFVNHFFCESGLTSYKMHLWYMLSFVYQ